MSANVTKLLHLSVAHLSVETRAVLDTWCKSIDLTRRALAPPGVRAPTLLAAHEYGWFVYCGGQMLVAGEDLPGDLALCLSYAANEDCDYVVFDADSPEDTSLPTFPEAGLNDNIAATTEEWAP